MHFSGALTPHELGELAALWRATSRADHQPVEWTAEELAEELADPHVHLATDSQTIRVNGELVAAVNTRHFPADGAGDEKVHIDGAVHPDHRGQGHGRALAQWGVQRARDILAESASSGPRFIRVMTARENERAHRLYERLGFTPVRWFEDLRRPLTEHDAIEPDATAHMGFRVIAWDPNRADEAREVKNLAFTDHWGSSPTSPDDWNQQIGGYASRPDLSFMAVDETGALIGLAVNKRFPSDDAVLGGRYAWVATLGTLREWRGKGVGTALVTRSLQAFAADGNDHAAIGVDSDNPSGARRLYAALGFEPWKRQVCHQLHLPATTTA